VGVIQGIFTLLSGNRWQAVETLLAMRLLIKERGVKNRDVPIICCMRDKVFVGAAGRRCASSAKIFETLTMFRG
jgi:hypothetical protein